MAIYLLHGDSRSTDAYLIKERQDSLLKGIDREGNLNYQVFDLSETGTTFQEVVASALTIPFLGGQRVVVARNVKTVEKFFKRPGGEEEEPDKVSGSADSILRSIEQLNNLPDDALLILVDSDEHLDGRTAFIKGLKKVGCVVESFKAMWFDPASGDMRQAAEFIQKEAGKFKLRMDNKTAVKFAERAGADRNTIVRELEKLALYVGEGKSPTVNDVVESVTESYEAGIFHLVDVIGQGRISEAMKALDDLMDHGAAPPYILAMIARQIRLIARTREAIDSGVQRNQGAIAKALGEAPFVIGKVLKQAGSFRQFYYPEVLEYLMETDVRLKRSTMPGKLALETLIARLAGSEGSQRRGYF